MRVAARVDPSEAATEEEEGDAEEEASGSGWADEGFDGDGCCSPVSIGGGHGLEGGGRAGGLGGSAGSAIGAGGE